MIRVLFCRSKRLRSWIVRAVTWSAWSHVALVDGDEAIEAVWPAVRVVPLTQVLEHYSAHVFAALPCDDPAAALRAARTQLGRPYDWKALVGFLLRRNWEDERAWFCSEFVAWAIARGGSPLFRTSVLRRVTPQHLWMVSSEPEPLTGEPSGTRSS